MTLLKWVLVIFTVLFAAGAIAVGVLIYWAGTIDSVPVAAADIETGGSYPEPERQALLAACEQRNVTKAPDTCTCLTDRAGTELSRYERLILTAGLDGSPSKVVALSKGLMVSGVPADRIKSVDEDAQRRVTAIMHECRLNQ